MQIFCETGNINSLNLSFRRSLNEFYKLISFISQIVRLTETRGVLKL